MKTNYYTLNDNHFMVNVYPTGFTMLRVWNGSGWQTANASEGLAI